MKLIRHTVSLMILMGLFHHANASAGIISEFIKEVKFDIHLILQVCVVAYASVGSFLVFSQYMQGSPMAQKNFIGFLTGLAVFGLADTMAAEFIEGHVKTDPSRLRGITIAALGYSPGTFYPDGIDPYNIDGLANYYTNNFGLTPEEIDDLLQDIQDAASAASAAAFAAADAQAAADSAADQVSIASDDVDAASDAVSQAQEVMDAAAQTAQDAADAVTAAEQALADHLQIVEDAENQRDEALSYAEELQQEADDLQRQADVAVENAEAAVANLWTKGSIWADAEKKVEAIESDIKELQEQLDALGPFNVVKRGALEDQLAIKKVELVVAKVVYADDKVAFEAAQDEYHQKNQLATNLQEEADQAAVDAGDAAAEAAAAEEYLTVARENLDQAEQDVEDARQAAIEAADARQESMNSYEDANADHSEAINMAEAAQKEYAQTQDHAKAIADAAAAAESTASQTAYNKANQTALAAENMLSSAQGSFNVLNQNLSAYQQKLEQTNPQLSVQERLQVQAQISELNKQIAAASQVLEQLQNNATQLRNL